MNHPSQFGKPDLARFPSRKSFAIWVASDEGAWLVLAGEHGWCHGDQSAAAEDAQWLSNNLSLPIRIPQHERKQRMAYEQHDNSAILFRNTDKTRDSDRDYKGEATVGGVKYWLSGWIKEGKRGKFMAFAFKPKDESTNSSKQHRVEEDSDEIPF
jgi:hypothetical protein